ncbi:MAG: hypothetical protein KFF73_18620 [Cyclobacteriaceae bacterium]|nr:hypothetical protein [Cyclobacteriaceae bacterium]
MNEIFDRKKFREFAENKGDLSVTIFLPSNKDRWIDPLKDLNRIKLKNFIKKISKEIQSRGIEDDQIKIYLEPL